jgi:hypothetical protein
MAGRCTASGKNDGHPQGEDRLMGDVDQGHGANGRVTEAPRETWLDAVGPADRPNGTNGTNGHDHTGDDAPLVLDVDLRAPAPAPEPLTGTVDPVEGGAAAGAVPSADTAAPAEVVGPADTEAADTPAVETAATDGALAASGRPDGDHGVGVTAGPTATPATDPTAAPAAAGTDTLAADATDLANVDPYGSPDWREPAVADAGGADPGSDADDYALSGYLCGVCEEPLPYGAELCPACATPVAPLDEDELVAGPYVLDDRVPGGWPEPTDAGPWTTTAGPAPLDADPGRSATAWAGSSGSSAPPSAPDPTVDLPAPAWPPRPDSADAGDRPTAPLWAPRPPAGSVVDADPDTDRPWPTLAAVDGPSTPPPATPPPTVASPGTGATGPAPETHGSAKTTRVAALALVAVLIVGTMAVWFMTRGRGTPSAAGPVTTASAAPAPAPITGEPAVLPQSNTPQFCAALLTFRVVGEYDTVAVRFMTDSGPFVSAIETAAVTAPEDARTSTVALVPLIHELADKVAVRSIHSSAELQAVLLPTGTPAWGHIYEVIIPAVIRHCAGRT